MESGLRHSAAVQNKEHDMATYFTPNSFHFPEKGAARFAAGQGNSLVIGPESTHCTLERAGADLIITNAAGACVIFEEFFSPPAQSLLGRVSTFKQDRSAATPDSEEVPSHIKRSERGVRTLPEERAAVKTYNGSPSLSRAGVHRRSPASDGRAKNAPDMDMILRGPGLHAQTRCK